jgi:hypothetical protein
MKRATTVRHSPTSLDWLSVGGGLHDSIPITANTCLYEWGGAGAEHSRCPGNINEPWYQLDAMYMVAVECAAHHQARECTP